MIPFAKYNKQVTKSRIIWKQRCKPYVKEDYEKKKDKNYLYLRAGL